MIKPDEKNFDIHNIKEKDYSNYKVTNTIDIECENIQNILSDLNINQLDYLKIDTQGLNWKY